MTEDPVKDVKKTSDLWINEMNTRPRLEIWPADDDWGQWVASHEKRAMSELCENAVFKDSPFCGPGYH